VADRLESEFHLRQSFARFDELKQAARGWNLDFLQLGPAQGRHYLEQVFTEHVLYSRCCLQAHFHQHGGSPLGYRTVAILASGSAGFRWCGELMTSDKMLVMPKNGEFDSVSSPGLDFFNISLSEELLQWAAQQHLGITISDVLSAERAIYRCGGERVSQLRRLLQKYSAFLPGRIHSGAASPLLDEQFGRSLALLVVEVMASAGPSTPRASQGRRQKAVATALKYLEDGEYIGVSVADFVRESGVSRRTLESAFQDSLGISPAAYIKIFRLHQFRRDLGNTSPETSSVAELASRHGFGHGGQLAADYRRLFDEPPSTTLQR